MSRHLKITLSFQGIPENEIKYKEKLDKLLAAVIARYPLLLNNDVSSEKVAKVEVENETLFLKIKKQSEKVLIDINHPGLLIKKQSEEVLIDLDHIVDHIRFGVKAISEDPGNCIKLMKNHPGPNFAAFLEKLKLQEADNVVLDILSNPPIPTNTNLVLWPLKDFPISLMNEEQIDRLISIIEQEIDMAEDQARLCVRLLDDIDIIQEKQSENTELRERFMIPEYPEECLKATLSLYQSSGGTINGFNIALKESVENPGQDLANVLNIASKIPIVIENIKIFSKQIFIEWKKRFRTVHSVIHSPREYQDCLSRKGLNDIIKTQKENIIKMAKLDFVQPGDGLYLVRSKPGVGQYAHVAVVTDTKLMTVVHAVPNTNVLEREYGKIDEGHFEKVIHEEDECFLVRHETDQLTGSDIARRARTFAIGLPNITFAYNVVEANCEVILDAAVGIFEKECGSLQGKSAMYS